MSSQNPVSQICYRAANKLRLMMTVVKMEYWDSRYLIYLQIEKKGYYLKPGSKGILCEKCIFENNETVKDSDGTEEKNRRVQPYMTKNFNQLIYRSIEKVLENPQVASCSV